MAMTTLLLALLLSPSASAEDTRGLAIVDVPTAPRAAYRQMHALIVGIDRYADSTLDLSYAVADAEGVAGVLAERFDFSTVRVLRNDEATRANVLSALDSYRTLEAEDALFLFWAGHGTQEDTPTGESIGYLVPHDGSFDRNRLLIDDISMAQLQDVVGKRVPAKHKLLVVDACYGGILATRDAKRPEVDEAYIAAATSEPVFQVFTAGRADQPVLDGGPGGHSVFTGRFIEALRRIDSFGTASMIHAEVAPKVRTDAFDRGERVQTPVFANLLGVGDFVFLPKGAGQDDPRVVEANALRGRLSRLAGEGACAPWLGDAQVAFDAAEAALSGALERRDEAAADAEAAWMRGMSVLLDDAGCGFRTP